MLMLEDFGESWSSRQLDERYQAVTRDDMVQGLHEGGRLGVVSAQARIERRLPFLLCDLQSNY